MLLTWCTCTFPQSLSADELEELKAEIVAETVAKIAGEVSFACEWGCLYMMKTHRWSL